MKSYITELLIAIALMFSSVAVHADAINFHGQLDLVLEDNGNGIYSGAPIGKDFSGSIDDSPVGGSITDGTTRTDFTCCIAAGGVNVENNDVLDDETATLLNLLSGTSFVAGDIVDAIDIEGDAVTTGGGRIEIGLSYILVPDAFDDNSLDNYPPDPDDVLVAVFFIVEEDNQGEDSYLGLGELDPNLLPVISSLGNFNGNNKTDLGVLLRDPVSGKNKLHVMDGGSGSKIKTVVFGPEIVRGSTTVPDSTGDLVPEFAVLVDGSLFARVKNVVNNTLLGTPTFNGNYDPVAFLSVGDAGGNVGPDVAVVGRNASTGKVQAQVKDVASGNLVHLLKFNKAFVPFDAVAVDNVGDSPAMEIAVLGIDAGGNVQAQVKDALSGNLIGKIQFNKQFTPLFFAAVPNAAGKLKHLAVLGRNASGVIQVQIKRVSNGALVNKIQFSKSYDPRALISFADSNGSGGGEIGVVGVNGAGKVRAQVKEIANGALVKLINFSASYAPVDVIAVNGVAGTGQNEIAVLGRNASDQHRLQIKDLLTGNLVKNIPVP